MELRPARRDVPRLLRSARSTPAPRPGSRSSVSEASSSWWLSSPCRRARRSPSDHVALSLGSGNDTIEAMGKQLRRRRRRDRQPVRPRGVHPRHHLLTRTRGGEIRSSPVTGEPFVADADAATDRRACLLGLKLRALSCAITSPTRASARRSRSCRARRCCTAIRRGSC